jgi:hypothetical protein
LRPLELLDLKERSNDEAEKAGIRLNTQSLAPMALIPGFASLLIEQKWSSQPVSIDLDGLLRITGLFLLAT